MGGDSKEVATKADALKSTNQDLALKYIEGNLVWKALSKGSLPTYLNEKERRMVMSALGAVVVRKNADGTPDPGFYEPVISFKRLLGNVDGSDNDGKPQIFSCTDGTGADECTILGTEAFESETFSKLAYDHMIGIFEKIRDRGPALTAGEIDFINATSVPVYKILASAASLPTESVAHEQIVKNADVIGAELAATFMLKAQDEAEKALVFISEEYAPIPSDWKLRYQMNLDLLKKGSVLDIASVVRSLYHRSKIKELPILERKLYDSALNLLQDEISFSLGKGKDEIAELIRARLES